MTDDSVGRMKVFVSVLQNSRRIRYSYFFYQRAPDSVKAGLIVLYGLKCYLSLARRHDSEQHLLFFASYPNEHRVLSHAREKLSTIPRGEVTTSLTNVFRLTAISDLFSFMPSSVRLFRFAKRLIRKHEFMPACRIFSTLTYYMRFKRLLDNDVKAVFIACQYSPECLGLAAAAHNAGRKVVFTNHAIASGETHYVAPLYADLVAVNSPAMADIYQRHSPHKLNIVPFTMAEPQRPMRVPNRNGDTLTVGIYLTALTDETRLQQIVREFSRIASIGLIFIRTHPAQVVNADLSVTPCAGVPIEISITAPLHEDIARTNIAVCGNSTVVVEILRGGKPVLYDHRLDDIISDYNGYAARELVMPYPQTLDEAVFEQMQQHYLSDNWHETMRYFDCGYHADEREIERGFTAAFVSIMQQS